MSMSSIVENPSVLSDNELRNIWREAGGTIFGSGGLCVPHGTETLAIVRKMVARIRAEERERCAQVCLAVEGELLT